MNSAILLVQILAHSSTNPSDSMGVGTAIKLRVVDAVDRRDLAHVSIVEADEQSFLGRDRAQFDRPLAVDAMSPLEFVAPESTKSRNPDRGVLCWVGARHYAWTRIRLYFDEPVLPVVELGRGGTVELRCGGQRPDDAGLPKRSRALLARYFDDGSDSVSDLVLRVFIGPGSTLFFERGVHHGEIVTLDGVPAGSTLITLEDRAYGYDSRLSRFAEERVELAVGSFERRELAPTCRAPLAGLVRVPEKWRLGESPILELQGPTELAVTLRRVTGSSIDWEFDAGLVVPGIYRATIPALWMGEQWFVGPSGTTRIRTSPLACFEGVLRFVDESTGAPVSIERAWWVEHANWCWTGRLRLIGRSGALRDDSRGGCVFRAPAGPGHVEIDSRDWDAIGVVKDLTAKSPFSLKNDGDTFVVPLRRVR